MRLFFVTSRSNSAQWPKWHRLMFKKWAENYLSSKYEFNQLLFVKDYHFVNFTSKMILIGTLIFLSLALKPKCSPVLSIEKIYYANVNSKCR